jgi:hypothetical protein
LVDIDKFRVGVGQNGSGRLNVKEDGAPADERLNISPPDLIPMWQESAEKPQHPPLSTRVA